MIAVAGFSLLDRKLEASFLERERERETDLNLTKRGGFNYI